MRLLDVMYQIHIHLNSESIAFVEFSPAVDFIEGDVSVPERLIKIVLSFIWKWNPNLALYFSSELKSSYEPL